jgi:hypothetical protein
VLAFAVVAAVADPVSGIEAVVAHAVASATAATAVNRRRSLEVIMEVEAGRLASARQHPGPLVAGYRIVSLLKCKRVVWLLLTD